VRTLKKILAMPLKVEKSAEIEVEYFDKARLKKFLSEKDHARNGMLQAFIDPLGIHNNVIKAVWSPHMCLVERKRNLSDVYNLRIDPNERAVTFEGKEYQSETIKLINPYIFT